MNLKERMARLEQENRRWKRMTPLFALIPTGMLLLMGANPQETMKTLTVSEIIFKDETGAIRGRITAEKGIAQQFFASNGKERYRLAVNDTAVVQDVRDNNNTLRHRLEVNGNGGIYHRYYDLKGKERIQTHVNEESVARHVLLNEEGKRRVSLFSFPKDHKDAPENAGHAVLNDQGEIRIWTGVTKTRVAQEMSDNTNTARVTMGINKESDAYYALFDRNKEGRFEVATFSDGSSAQSFFDKNGEMRASTAIDPDNTFNFYVEKGVLEQVKEAMSWFSFIKHGRDMIQSWSDSGNATKR
jgi:hypothetical protein